MENNRGCLSRNTKDLNPLPLSRWTAMSALGAASTGTSWPNPIKDVNTVQQRHVSEQRHVSVQQRHVPGSTCSSREAPVRRLPRLCRREPRERGSLDRRCAAWTDFQCARGLGSPYLSPTHTARLSSPTVRWWQPASAQRVLVCQMPLRSVQREYRVITSAPLCLSRPRAHVRTHAHPTSACIHTCARAHSHTQSDRMGGGGAERD